MTIRSTTVLLQILLIFSVSGLFAANPELPGSNQETDVVEGLHQKLTYIMRNSDALGYQGRYDEISTTIAQSFNVPLIARVILGRHWPELDESQKSDFITLYGKLIIATYASRFNSYNGESFQTRSVEDLNRGRKLVKTELKKSDGEVVSLDYLISQNEDSWMIISVIANGANDISIKRGEYSDVIKSHGFNVLIEEIQNKIDQSVN